MEELRNIGGKATAADSDPLPLIQESLVSTPSTSPRPLEKLRRAKHVAGASRLSVPVLAAPQLEGLSPDSARKVPLHKWEYTDDFGKIQGPFDALRIIKWIQSGFFDSRGGTLFRRTDESSVKPLTEHLAAIVSEAYTAMMLRMQKPVKVVPTEELPEVLEEPMDISNQLKDIESILDVKALHKSLGTCDLMVVLVPPKRSEKASAWTDEAPRLADGMLLKARVPQQIFKIPVHSAMLRLSSPTWLTEITALEEKHKLKMLYTESPDRQEMLKYIIECQNPEALRCIINYIYGYKASISQGNPLLLVAVYLEASRFKIAKICKEVLQPLSAPMSLEALIQLAFACEATGCDQILKECVRVLCDCAFALFSGFRHLQLGPKTMALILQNDNLQLDEMQVYQSAAAWLHQYIERFGDIADPDVLIADAQAIYKAIRFCSMSPQRLQDVREPELDSIILNACLRKFFGNEWKPRVFPWTENAEYEVSWRGSLYPTTISRVYRHRARRQWAWTIGTPRFINEALFAIEIVATDKGAIHLGVATEDVGNRGRLACFFDPEVKAFVTANIGVDPTSSAYHTAHQTPVCQWNRNYRNGDIVLVRLSVGITALHITLQVLNTNSMKASFVLPHKVPASFPCHVLRRPFIQVCPFLETLHSGDTVAVPELQPNCFTMA
ncbi:hypothetical protein Efla_001208 [Eimeria flavescens]